VIRRRIAVPSSGPWPSYPRGRAALIRWQLRASRFHPWWVTSQEDLLNLPRPKWVHHEIAILGGPQEDDLSLALGYLTAGEIVARQWIEHGPDDSLPVPILYLYRHSIELSLKWLIRTAARCAIRDGYTGPEDLSPEKLGERLRKHNIKKLADCLNRYMGHLKLIGPENRIDPASWNLLRWLDSGDATGETYRYAVVGQGDSRIAARPVQANVNFYEQVNELHKLANLLYAGYTTPLDEYRQMQDDMSEY
jgi:hypothetical protein